MAVVPFFLCLSQPFMSQLKNPEPHGPIQSKDRVYRCNSFSSGQFRAKSSYTQVSWDQKYSETKNKIVAETTSDFHCVSLILNYPQSYGDDTLEA